MSGSYPSDRKQHAYLCVGGPYSGRRYASYDPYFKVANRLRMPLEVPKASPVEPVSIKYTVYVADHVRSKTDEVWFWRPEEQGLVETVRTLLKVFEQAHNIVWEGNPYEYAP